MLVAFVTITCCQYTYYTNNYYLKIDQDVDQLNVIYAYSTNAEIINCTLRIDNQTYIYEYVEYCLFDLGDECGSGNYYLEIYTSVEKTLVNVDYISGNCENYDLDQTSDDWIYILLSIGCVICVNIILLPIVYIIANVNIKKDTESFNSS